MIENHQNCLTKNISKNHLFRIQKGNFYVKIQIVFEM